MHVIFALFSVAALVWPVAAGAQQQPAALEGMPCAEVAALPLDPGQLDERQLFIAARAYDFGICVDENDEGAFALYRAGAEQGRMLMMARLGHFYAEGIGKPVRPAN